ncbi:MAG: hypothetical protein Rubg2KO_36620 [Rubricoccaceae bacterium]
MTSPFTPECEALAAVAQSARAQLDALRTGSPETFERAAADTLDAVAELDRRRTTRARRMTSPNASPATPEDRAALDAAAAEARTACSELEVALQHAVALGRDMIGAWQQMAQPATSQVYTANGAVGASASGGRIHQTG